MQSENDVLNHIRGGRITMDESLLLLALCSTLPESSSNALLHALEQCGAFIWPERPLIPDQRLDLANISDGDAMVMFRFTSRAIVRLSDMLGLPHVLKTSNRDKAMAPEALAMVLRRLVVPGRLFEVAKVFGRSTSACSRIIIHTSKILCIFLQKYTLN